MQLSSLLTKEQIILDQESVIASLIEREDMTSTGMGSGVAIPHCFSDKVDDVICVFGKSSVGIEFESLDHAPVKFLVLFVVPESEHQKHLQTLAAVSKMLKSCEVRKSLAKATSEEDVLSAFEEKSTPSKI